MVRARYLARIAGRDLLRPGLDTTGMESDLIALLDGLQLQWLLDPAGIDMADRLRRRLGELITVPVP